MGFLSLPKDAITNSDSSIEQTKVTIVLYKWSNRCKLVFFSALGIFIVSWLILFYNVVFSTR